MSSPLKKEYQDLVKKLHNGTITAHEMQVLERYYSLFRDEAAATAQMSDHELSSLEDRLQAGIAKKIDAGRETVVPMYRRAWFKVAAMLAVVATATLVLRHKVTVPGNDKVATASIAQTTATNHFMLLPDGSRIVLHAGSKLALSNDFKTGSTREVTLVGEAYFDVKHNSQRPFIIHTRNINTTVLGTAFNIKAYTDQKNIVVTVTRGRVKVERGRNLLAILTPNKQLTANVNESQTVETAQNVVASQALDWARADMSFDAMPFKQLAEHLAKRYDVQISFKNPALTDCPITGRFNGTESLKEVLDILSQTRGTSYAINGNNIVIDGKGCNE